MALHLPKKFPHLLIQAVKSWSNDYAPSMGAAISYYTVFSLAPLLVIVIAVAGAVFGHEAVQGLISAQISGIVGPQGAKMVEGLIAAASDKNKGLIAGLISVIVLIVGATTVFNELQSALDRIWKVPESAKPSGVWGLLRERLLSFGLVLGVAFLLMVSLVVSAGLAALGNFAGGLMPGWNVLLYIINLFISLSLFTLLFALIYRFMPSTTVAWRDVWIGAFVTAVLFEVGKILISLYIGKSGMSESFQAAGAIVVLLAWVYYASQIFLLGAEFTKAYADADRPPDQARVVHQENPTRRAPLRKPSAQSSEGA
ncbi:YihY/virulence factor BrkB family protein [Ramlibacter sp. MMS24-I3-19]|uniref:YihY/virulence factor BrkB family protein n=1 Tax=Ramlibacter sp. MMS24-I3-19 TaxID=3416606 RepID=UPI003CFD1CC7